MNPSKRKQHDERQHLEFGNGTGNLVYTLHYHNSNPLFCTVQKKKMKDKFDDIIATGSRGMIDLALIHQTRSSNKSEFINRQ
jgi:hypothetical protein